MVQSEVIELKCPKCDNVSKNPLLKTDEYFEITNIKWSDSDWDEWDTIADVKCLKCNHQFKFEQ